MSSHSAQLSSFASANRGPLTTIWDPPSTCLSQTTLVSYPTTSQGASNSDKFTVTKLFINHFSWGDAACYPSTLATFDGTTRWNNGYYYSPGICPSGWASACQQKTVQSIGGFTQVLGTQTSGVVCCPSSWSCVAGSTVLAAHGCSTVLTQGQTLTSVWYAPQPTPNVIMPVPKSPSLGNFTVTAQTSALCDGIPVLWQSTDIQILALLSPTTASSSSTASRTTYVVPETGKSTNSSVPVANNGGLSSGSKAAIGVVIPLAVIALVAGIFFFMRRRKQRSQGHQVPSEMDSHQQEIHEMSDSRKVVEADAANGIVEMGDYNDDMATQKVKQQGEDQRPNVIHEMPAN